MTAKTAKTAKPAAPKVDAPAPAKPETKPQTITILKADAPLRGSRAARFALVRTGMTKAELAAALKAGGYKVSAGGMIGWMVEAGIAKID
jgi:hypothetical protein